MARWWWAIPCLLALGCSDAQPIELDSIEFMFDTSGFMTALEADYVPAAPAPPERDPVLPEPPALPERTCPDGWGSATDGDGLTLCDPYPVATDPDACAPDEALFVGESTCTRVGEACDPADPFAVTLPAGSVLFVDQTEGAGGNGTRGAPYDSLTTALGMATAGTTIALARGTYTDEVTVPEGVTLRGACVAETLLEPVTTARSLVYLMGAGSRLENLRVSGAAFGVEANGATVDAAMEDVIVENVVQAGLLSLGGARLDLRTVVVRDVAPAASGQRGFGMNVSAGGVVAGSRVDIARTHDVAIVVSGGSQVTLEDAAIRETLPRAADDGNGVHVLVQQGSSVTFDRTLLRGTNFAAILGLDDANVVLRDVRLEDVRATASLGSEGWGVNVQRGGSLLVERSHIEDVRAGAIATDQVDSTVRDTLIRNVRAEPTGGRFGRGITTTGSPQVVLERVFVDDAREIALFMDVGTTLSATDLTVRGTRPTLAEPLLGLGFQALSGTRVSLARARMEDSRAVGVRLVGEAIVSDLTVTGTRTSDPTSPFAAAGLQIFLGASVTGERILLEGNEAISLDVADEAQATLFDLTVRDPVGRELDDLARGISVRDGADLSLQYGLIEGAADVAIVTGVLSGESPTVSLRDTVVRGTRGLPEVFSPGLAGTSELGYGMNFANGTDVTLERVLLEDNGVMGVLALDSTLAITDLLVRDTRPSMLGTLGGRSLSLERSTADVTRAHFIENTDVAVRANDSVLVGSEVHVEVTHQLPCPECGAFRNGVGVGSYGADARVALESFVVSSSEAVALQVARDAQLSLRRGVVRSNVIGLNVQSSAADLGDLTEDVVYVDNQRNLDSSMLPLPESLVGLSPI